MKKQIGGLLLLLTFATANLCVFNGAKVLHPGHPYIACDPATGASIPTGKQGIIDLDGDGVDDSACIGNGTILVGVPCSDDGNEMCTLRSCDETGLCKVPAELLLDMYGSSPTEVETGIIICSASFAFFLVMIIVYAHKKKSSQGKTRDG